MIVHTLTGSIYHFDGEANTVQRHVGDESVDLRRDGEPVPVVSMATPVVGERLVMVLDLRGDGVHTQRSTSPVTKVEL